MIREEYRKLPKITRGGERDCYSLLEGEDGEEKRGESVGCEENNKILEKRTRRQGIFIW